MPTAFNRGQREAPQVPNEGQSSASQLPYETAPTPNTGPVTPGNDEESFLFGPTARPNEHPAAGSGPGSNAPPAGVYAAMATIVQAAAEPGAPLALKILAAHLARLMQGN